MFCKIKKNSNEYQDKIEQIKSLAGSIAHEAKNPLFGIKGCCELMKNNLNELTEYVDLILNSSNQGLATINIILNNIRDGDIDKSNFIDLSIVSVVEKALIQYAYKSEEEKKLLNLNFDLGEDFIFKGDENLMISVICNLLTNSLHYKVKVDITIKSEFDSNYLYFKDYGPGIEEDKLKQLFDNFFTSGKSGGTGLGLPFCQRTMIAFGGSINCKSRFGEWTEFELRFPKISNNL